MCVSQRNDNGGDSSPGRKEGYMDGRMWYCFSPFIAKQSVMAIRLPNKQTLDNKLYVGVKDELMNEQISARHQAHSTTNTQHNRSYDLPPAQARSS